MNDRGKWNSSIASNAKIQELLQEDSRVNGREVVVEFLEGRMAKTMASVFGTEPVDYETYRNAFSDYRAYKNLLGELTVLAPKRAEVARNKLDELDQIESA